jgi:GNAT superfamily N-acetyltransferase
MLLWFKSVKDLDFRRLMSVYEEGNLENAADRYPDLPPLQGIMQAEQDFYQFLREIFFPTEGAAYAVWEENGEYISALRLESYRDGLLLSALETAPQYRRRGYAKRLITAVFENLPEAKVYSHVSKRNVASLRTHISCGFRKISDHATYLDGSVLTSSCTLCRRSQGATL